MPDDQNTHEHLRRLCPADADVLDAMHDARVRGVEQPCAISGATSGERRERLGGLMNLLDQYPLQEPGDDLVRRTLERVRNDRQRERFAEQVRLLSQPRPTLGVSWQQIVTAAAVFILGFSLLLPVLERNRQESQRIAGASSLAGAGIGFGQYAVDHRDTLPRRKIVPGSIWWNVGQPITADDQPVTSNSAHLYLLVRRGYVEAETLSHPANPFAPAPGTMTRRQQDWLNPQAISFSYQNQYRDDPFKLSANSMLVILADRNPLFVVRIGRIQQDMAIPLDAPSRVYHGQGQNILTTDGAVTFTRRPVVPRGKFAGDLIWGAHGIDRYLGTEAPADANDSFLVP